MARSEPGGHGFDRDDGHPRLEAPAVGPYVATTGAVGPGNSRALRVAVVSHHALTRAGVARLIEARDHHVDTFGTIEGYKGYDGAAHQVVVYDLSRRHDASYGELGVLLDARCRVVVLESPSDPSRAGHVRSMGVLATIGADASAAELVRVVEQAASVRSEDRAEAHELYRSAQLRELLSTTDVTAREAQVLSLIALGCNNKEIAAELFLSINSVKSYIRSLYGRICVTRRSEAVVWAVTRGLGPGHVDDTAT